MASDYTLIPYFKVDGLRKVSVGLFGEAMRNVISAAGPMSDEQALRIVEAVLGPLKLLSPPSNNFKPCGHAYFRYEGGWLFCAKDHDEDDGDPELHRTEDGECEWYSDDADDRAFFPAPGLGGLTILD